MKGPALVVMARQPVPGRVKTRLFPYLSPEQSASLYTAFLRDAVGLALSVPEYAVYLAYTPASSRRFFYEFLLPRVELIRQKQGKLGGRMAELIHRLTNEEFSPVVVIGSDIPMLQPGILKEALKILEETDICLGPSGDGGYYLIGMNTLHKELFKKIPWSTPEVLKVTLERIEEAGLSAGLLEEFRDVDTIEDLTKLRADLLETKTWEWIPKETQKWMDGFRVFG
jgi:rSAM/selenodomain-associated transferase 1